MKRGVPKPKKSERIDILKLSNHLDKLDLSKNDNLNFWLYCKIALKTGLRSVDILNMKVNQIYFDDRKANVIEQKTKRKVQVPMSKDILDKINRDNEYVIFNDKYKTQVSLMTINRRLKKVFKDDNVNVSSHSIRKSIGYYIYKNTNNDIMKAQAFLGHKNVTTTQIYLEIGQDELNELYAMIDY